MSETEPRFVDNTLALFKQLGESVASADPNTGDGGDGQRPPEGTHESVVTDVQWEQIDMKRRPDGVKIKAVVVRFLYQTAGGPGVPDLLSWRGEPFFFPLNEAEVVDDGQRTSIRMAKERLAGHISSLLRRPPSKDTGADLLEVKKLCNGDTKLLAAVTCSYREAKGRTYFSEYIRQRLSP